MTNGKLKGAVIGYGGAFHMGRSHAYEMQRVGFEFVAACDLSEDRRQQAQADFPGIRTFATVEELLAQDDIDLITIITPHNAHAPLARQVLASGKHCILEKPMCIHLKDADELVQLARQHNRMLSIYHNRRWDGWYLTVKDLIAQGKIGNIYHMEMFRGGYAKPNDWWRSDKAVSGGAFYDWGAHYVDYLLGIVPGKVASIRGHVHNLVWDQYSNEDQVDSTITFESGAVGHIQISAIARVPKPHFRILGTKGGVEVKALDSPTLTLYHDLDGQNAAEEVALMPGRGGVYYENVADHLYHGADLHVRSEEGRRIIAVLETTERSAREGRELPLPFEQE